MRIRSGKMLTPVRNHSQFIHLYSLFFGVLDDIYFFWGADNYTKLCTIDADLSRVPLLPKSKASGSGSFYRLDYDIVLLFGMTELKAQVAWKENVSLIIQFYLIVSYFVQSNRFLLLWFF